MRAALFVLALGLVPGPVAPVAAAGEAPSRAEELRRIRSEIGSLERRLAEVESQQSDRRDRLAGLALEVRLQEERLAEARTESRMVEERLDELAVAIADLEARLESSRRALQRGLATLYRLGGGSLWRWLLTAPAPSDALAGRRILRYLSWRRSERVQAFRADREALEARRREQEEARKRSRELLERETARLARLDEARRRHAAALAELEREEEELARRAAELTARQDRLTELLVYLSAERPDTTGEVPIQRFKGVLDWPVTAEVAQAFGPRSDPRYGTTIPHNGITLAADPGSEVRAIYPGVVVFAEDFQGFGITVVIHHPDRVFTLFSGLSAARVVKDDVVSSGELLGRTGEGLYFEIRVENRPEDPLAWLR